MPMPLIVFTASLNKKLIKCTRSIALYGAATWTFGKQITNTLLFGNVVLKKDGEDQLDQLCEKLSHTHSQRRKEQPAYNKMLEG